MEKNKKIYFFNLALISVLLLMIVSFIFQYSANRETEKTYWSIKIETKSEKDKIQLIDFSVKNEIGYSISLNEEVNQGNMSSDLLMLNQISAIEMIQESTYSILPNYVSCKYYSFQENKFYEFAGELPYDKLIKEKSDNNILVFKTGASGKIELFVNNNVEEKFVMTLIAKEVKGDFSLLLTNFHLKNITSLEDYKDILFDKINVNIDLKIDSLDDKSVEFFGDDNVNLNETKKITHFPSLVSFTSKNGKCINRVDYYFEGEELLKAYKKMNQNQKNELLTLEGKLSSNKKDFTFTLKNKTDSIALNQIYKIECL